MKFSLKIMGILAVLFVLMAPACAATGKPSVTVSDVKVTPLALMPGDTGTITITVSNPVKTLSGESSTVTDTYSYGSGTSGGMTTPSHQSSTSVTSSSAPDGAVSLKEVTLLADAPLHVTSKSSYLDYGRLGMGEKVDFTFTITVDDTAAGALYPLTLKVRTDDDGVYVNYPLNVKVDSSSLKVVVNDAPKSFSTTRKTVVLDIVNFRPNGVTGVSVVPAGDDFIFKPIQEYVVGSIGPGEMYTVQFDVTSKNSTYSSDPSFKVVYMNGENRHETAPKAVYSDYTVTEATKPAGDDNTALYLVGIIAVLAIALGGIFLYMRGKRAKR